MVDEDKKFIEWAFESSGRNPLAWEASARNLIDAANAVKAKVIDFSPMMHSLEAVQAMLVGYALECLLKGMWIKNNKAWLDEHKEFSLTKDGKYQRIPGTNDHQLIQLADAANVELSADERALLGRLTAFILYAGRYPIATTPEQMLAKKTPAGAVVSPKFISREELELAEQLCSRLSQEVLPWT